MCVVSYIGDSFRHDFPQRHPTWPKPSDWIPSTIPVSPLIPPNQIPIFPIKQEEVSREEFDAMKKEIEALRKLLEAAKEYDDATGQPDCEMDEKVDFIKKLAEFVGVDVSKVFK